jgi:DNA-binding beta-propeller fold protein YncE
MTDNTAANAVVAYHRRSLTYDRANGLLFAVNPGSSNVSVFKVRGDQLELSQVIWSGGDFPVSVTVHGNHAYVLNALGGGTLSGYRISGGWVAPIPGSPRSLGLGTTAATAFTGTPGQVTFSPDGKALFVTTKAATNAVDVFAVHADGTLSATPTVNTLAGDVPFAVAGSAGGEGITAG